MIRLPEKPTVYFDVDQTLVLFRYDSSETDLVDIGDGVMAKPHRAHIRAIREHKARGHVVVVWSGGGTDWAAKIVKLLNLTDSVDVVIAKPSWYYDDKASEEFMQPGERSFLEP